MTKGVRMNDWSQHITCDPEILVGKPAVRGTRLSVEHILSLFAAGWSVQEVLENYPTLDPGSLRAVFAFAAQAVRAHSPLSEPEAE